MPKILFAVDGSEASLRATRGLAGMLRWLKPIEVEVLNAQPEPSLLGELVPHSLRERAESRLRDEGERAMATAHAMLRETAARCTTTVRFGDAPTAIAHAAETLGCEIIAMGSHGAGAISSLITGSVTTRVIQVGTRPVLVIPSAQPLSGSAHGLPARLARVLVSVDGSAGATAAVREAIRIAAWFRAAPEVHLLAVYEGTPLDVEIAAMLTADALRDYQQKQFEAALLPARKMLAGTPFTATEHTAVGPAVERIRATATALRCDLVCVGTRGMGAAGNLVLGSTATKLLRGIDVPVLMVPPAAA